MSAAFAIASGVALFGAACVPEAPPTSSTTTTTTTTVPTGPTVTGEACRVDSGVTVVVDFTALDDSVEIGCAQGAQANGVAALAAAGFTSTDESGAGSICTINGVPAEGFPFCWLGIYDADDNLVDGGYWSYWQSPDRSVSWDFSPVGPGSGPIADGTILGWSWAPLFDGSAPRVTTAGLDAYTPALAECEVPEAPVLSIIADSEVLPFSVVGGGPIEVAAIPAADDLSTAVYAETSTLALAAMSGPTRVLARSAADDCEVGATFDAVYDVHPTYAPRSALAGSWSPAVPAASTSIVGWATGHSDYTPGLDVSASFQDPVKGYGAPSSGLVVLGNGGSITMTFDGAITDGPGDDLAVFENGFYQSATSEQLFVEYGYVEVSSNGTDFVRFDSASQWPTPLGSFAFADARQVGGLAGRDGADLGTPFDLTALRNTTAVRNGTVDLTAITHVRIVDIVGANDYPNVGDTYPDSFGRQIFDTHKTTGSGGFDLAGIAVLNQAAL